MPEKGKKHKEEGQHSEAELQQAAIKAGMQNLIRSNPGLRDYAVLMMNNIDYNKIDNFVKESEEKYKTDNLSYEEKNNSIYNGIANYVASGGALKNKAIQTLFDKSKEGKLDRSILEKIVNFFKPNKFEGTEYFEKATNAYSDMYDILSQNELAQKKLPKLAKAAEAMKMYGFLDVALKNFKAHGMMNDKEYKMLSQIHYQNTAIRAEKGKKSLESYIIKEKEDLEKEEKEKTAQTVAASIIGFIGVLLVLFNLRITGAVIGGDNPVTIGIVGVFMLLFSLLLYFRPLKRTFKK
jgi:hypothetical protein